MGAIGIFDSGFGGLHVLRGITNVLPEYDYIYLGDSRRAPYGPRTQEEILEFTKQGIDFLFSHGAAMVILACNTASSEALRQIQQTDGRKILGVLVPFAEEAVAKSASKRIGVLATEATVRSGAYKREITKLVPDAFVYEQACPKLVPLVEAGEEASGDARKYVGGYLREPLLHDIDTLVLGCTHYGFLEPLIREAVGPSITLVSESSAVPPRLSEYLKRHPDVEQLLSKDAKHEFYTTGSVEAFNKLGTRFFGAEVDAQVASLS